MGPRLRDLRSTATTPGRRARRLRPAPFLVAVLVALPLALAGCGSTPDQPSERGADCAGGQVRFLQGHPTRLPGGGQGGIGSMHADADPPTVRLVLSRDHGPAPDTGDLRVGDSFELAGTTYRITGICAGKVTAKTVR